MIQIKKNEGNVNKDEAVITDKKRKEYIIHMQEYMLQTSSEV